MPLGPYIFRLTYHAYVIVELWNVCTFSALPDVPNCLDYWYDTKVRIKVEKTGLQKKHFLGSLCIKPILF
jgi:hypothetical protein